MMCLQGKAAYLNLPRLKEFFYFKYHINLCAMVSEKRKEVKYNCLVKEVSL